MRLQKADYLNSIKMLEKKTDKKKERVHIMELPQEEWVEWRKSGDFKEIGRKCGVDQLLARIMVNRGGTEETSYSYFHGELSGLSDPGLMKDLLKACDMILEVAGQCREGIAIASDYDADGLFSGFSLHRAFDRLGIPNKTYVPDRIEEGYGLNERIVRQAKEEGFDFLITCDNGIAAAGPVSLAKELGMTVIVTDHHEVPYCLSRDASGADGEEERICLIPEADAVVDPKQQDCSYPFKYLCGTGIVYLLIKLLYEKSGIPQEELGEFLEYAAIATVTDVMPLVGENRIIVRHGLAHLERTKNTGLRALMEVCGIYKQITSYDVGFVIGPSLNATGRLTEIQEAVNLLSEEDYEKALKMAGEIRRVNRERQLLTEEYTKKAFDLLEGEKETANNIEAGGNGGRDAHNAYMGDTVICLYLKGAHESIVGLVAGKIRERYNRPVLVFTDAKEEGMIKGSGRSIAAYNMFQGLTECRELLAGFGGHPMAAGFSMKMENYEKLKKKLNSSSGLTGQDLVRKVYIDAVMPFGYITKGLIRQFSMLEPFGNGNEAPSFGERRVGIEDLRIIGKNHNMLKLTLVNREGVKMEGVYFGDAEGFFNEAERVYGPGEKESLLKGDKNRILMNIIYYPDINEYKGYERVQVKIKKYRFI